MSSTPCKQYRFSPGGYYPTCGRSTWRCLSAPRLEQKKALVPLREWSMIDERFRRFWLGEYATLPSHVILSWYYPASSLGRSTIINRHEGAGMIRHKRLQTLSQSVVYFRFYFLARQPPLSRIARCGLGGPPCIQSIVQPNCERQTRSTRASHRNIQKQRS